MHNKPHTEESKAKMSAARAGKPNIKRRRSMVIINGVDLYRCSTCKEYFLVNGFYKNKRTVLGITSECKKCFSKTFIRTRDKENERDKNREFMRKSRAANLENFRERERKYVRLKNLKVIARMMANCAVKRGDLIKPDYCEECGTKKKITAHHEDYSKPLEVKWLCYECHGKKHRKTSFKKVRI